jgi:uncharacterized protein YndB with AHSA1/START domain
MGMLKTSSHVEAVCDAPIDAVWALVTDVTRTGEWSHETQRAVWVDGATGAVPGARFRGANKNGVARWSRTCEVLDAAPYTFRFRTIPTFAYPDSTEWTFTLTADGTKTRIEQSFEVVKINPMMSRIYFALIPSHRDRTEALQRDIERLGAAVEKTAKLS